LFSVIFNPIRYKEKEWGKCYTVYDKNKDDSKLSIEIQTHGLPISI